MSYDEQLNYVKSSYPSCFKNTKKYPFYTAICGENGIKDMSIKYLDDITKIQIIDKDMISHEIFQYNGEILSKTSE